MVVLLVEVSSFFWFKL